MQEKDLFILAQEITNDPEKIKIFLEKIVIFGSLSAMFVLPAIALVVGVLKQHIETGWGLVTEPRIDSWLSSKLKKNSN